MSMAPSPRVPALSVPCTYAPGWRVRLRLVGEWGGGTKRWMGVSWPISLCVEGLAGLLARAQVQLVWWVVHFVRYSPKRARKKTKKKKTGRGYEIRKSQLRELQGLTKESFPYQPHHHRWRWAINEIANIDERNWRSMLDLFQEVKNQGFSKRSFNSSEK